MESKIEIIQINISGEDKPGMTSSLTDILARYDAFILDIGQANIHQSLTLGILFMTTSDKSGAILKELLFKASELGVMIRFTPITEEHYQAWVGRQGKNRYIITLLGRQVTARHIAGVTKAVAEQGLNIDAIKRLTGRMPLEEENRATRACIELSVRGTLGDKAVLQKRFMELSNEGVDISFQKDDIFRRSRRLICFDMDSTLIETEVIDELADRAGVGPEVRAVTESAMRGEIDFTESFTRRIALLRGLDVSVMEEIARNLPITEGLERLMTILKRVGYKTAILSGGFTYFGNYLKQKYGFDYVYANELEVEEGRLTGRHVGEIVDGRRKAELLRLLCQVENINIAQSIAVGDGANDLPMLDLAGVGHRVPRQAQGESYGQPVDIDDRSGRRTLFPRSERFLDRINRDAAPFPSSLRPARRRMLRRCRGSGSEERSASGGEPLPAGPLRAVRGYARAYRPGHRSRGAGHHVR